MDVTIYEHGDNWLIRAMLDTELVDRLDGLVDRDIDGFVADKDNYTCKGDAVQQYWLQRHDGNYISKQDLADAVSALGQIVGKLCVSAELFDSSALNTLRPDGIWTVKGDEGSFHTIHQHNGKGSVLGISTVLYLNVPETNDDEKPENNVYFVMNSSAQTPFSASQSRVITHSPKRGELFVFPNWLLHGTYPQSKGLRQTFNADYSAQ